MVFSSHIFLFYFLALALGLYYASPKWGKHTVLTLVSYVFYGWWNPPFMLLMLISTLIDYYCGKAISRPGATLRQRKLGVLISVVVNLGILAFFKYTTFVVSSTNGILGTFGQPPLDLPPFFSNIILPLGISFYTFQSMSYSIDLYRGHARPADSLIDFACYVSMFPQLVAGPIVRYGSVADQLRERTHSVQTFVLGVSRFNLGFAKKILLANPMGNIADACFGAGEGVLAGPAAWVGVTAYTFQIYFDFSAYSDMAIGLGRMFGFTFPENFDSPYKSKSITEFWRRWHISLSSFLRDYLYIPLGGNRKRPSRTYVNLMTVMVLGGLWHGASWNFVVWGTIHGGMLALERKFGRGGAFSHLPSFVKVILTFVVVLITWVFFRAENFEVASRYLAAMFGFGGGADTASILTAEVFRPANLLFLAICAISAWAAPRTVTILEKLTLTRALVSLALLIISVAVMFAQGFNPFLYFQF